MNATAGTSGQARRTTTALAILCVVGLLNAVDRNILGALVEPIKAEFQISDTMIGILSGLSFSVFYATLGIPISRWADRGDRVTVISLSLLVWSVMTACCGLARSFWQLMLARFGVGAGEAGSIPAAQSLIIESYATPSRRAWAMGIFTSSQTLGSATGFALGGYVAHYYGWRAAFVVVAVVGIAFTPVVRMLLKDPRCAEPREAATNVLEPTRESVRVLFAKPAYRNILAAIVTYYVMAYGVLTFMVSVLVRIHGLDIAQAGATFGAVTTVGAVVGGVLGGVIAGRLAARDVAWLAGVPGWGLMIAIPFYEFSLLATDVTSLVSILVVATILLSATIPAMFSALHVVCGSKRRAFSVAMAFFFVNLIGIGLGPLLSGFLSDRFAVTYGPAEGLRYSLMTLVLVLMPAGYLMLRAARHLRADAEE